MEFLKHNFHYDCILLESSTDVAAAIVDVAIIATTGSIINILVVILVREAQLMVDSYNEVKINEQQLIHTSFLMIASCMNDY